jgi:PAS domain-containing protein
MDLTRLVANAILAAPAGAVVATDRDGIIRLSNPGAGDLLSVPGIRKDGHQISLEFTIVPLKDGEGRMWGLAAVMRDVTSRFEEIRRLRKKLADATAPPSPH